MKDKYSFGNCSFCNHCAPLKNGKCLRCDEKNKMPGFFADLVKNKEKEE